MKAYFNTLKIKKLFKELPYLLLAFFILGYLIYIRVVKEHLPSGLKQNLYANGSYFPLIFYGILICIHKY